MARAAPRAVACGNRSRKNLGIREGVRQQMHIDLVFSETSVNKDTPHTGIMEHQLRRPYLLCHDVHHQPVIGLFKSIAGAHFIIARVHSPRIHFLIVGARFAQPPRNPVS